MAALPLQSTALDKSRPVPLRTWPANQPVVQGQAAADLLAAPCRCKQSCRGPQSCLPFSWSLCTSTRPACCQAGKSFSRCAEETQAPPCLRPQRRPDWQQTPLTGHSSGLTAQAILLSWWDLPKHLCSIFSAAGQKDLQGPSRVAARLQRIHVRFTPASRQWLRRGLYQPAASQLGAGASQCHAEHDASA